jgi:hypothetical protein
MDSGGLQNHYPNGGIVECRLFTLVPIENDAEIFAWGMQITDDTGTEAVVYRRDPVTQQYTLGLHSSAESAQTGYSLVEPMSIRWGRAERWSFRNSVG